MAVALGAGLITGALSGCTVGPAGRFDGPSPSEPTKEPVATAPPVDVFPAALDGRPWIAGSGDGTKTIGMLGSDLLVRIPAGDAVLAVTPDYVISSSLATDGAGSVVSIAGPSGKLLATVRVDPVLVFGALAGDTLLASGYDPASDGDSGILAISLGDASVRTFLAPIGDAVTRTLLHSPSGKTIVSATCAGETCGADVIDSASLTSHHLAIAGWPSALSDDSLLVRRPGDYSTAIEAVDLASGTLLWAMSGAEFQAAYFTSAGDLILSRRPQAPKRTWQLVRIDRAGSETLLYESVPDAIWDLWAEFSSDTVAVVSSLGDFEMATMSAPPIKASILDLVTGVITDDGLVISTR